MLWDRAGSFACLIWIAFAGIGPLLTMASPVIAEEADAKAFEAAKELGTIEAWDAFLKSYPTGFHADLARAYRTKLTTPAQPAVADRDNRPSAPAERLSCNERAGLKSTQSTDPVRLTFVNVSGMQRAILWLDETGQPREKAAIDDGQSARIDTFVTHPFMITDGPGNCIEIFTPGRGNATVKLVTANPTDGDADEEPAAPAKPRKEWKQSPEKKKTVKKSEPRKQKLVCGKNYKLRNGECVLMQNCGKNAYRSPEGDCYCNKNYQMKNGKCVWKTDKQGFEVQPWKKPGCRTWQAQCSAGNNAACGKVEANCQVN